MKVLHLISSSGFFGAEKVLVELATATRALSGITPVVGIIQNRYNPHTEIYPLLKNAGILCEIFPCRRRFDVKTVAELREFIQAYGITAVHSHGYKSNFYALAATLLLPVRRFVTVHNWIRTDRKLRAYALMDKFMLRCFHGIAVVSAVLREEVCRAGIPSFRVRFIRNGISTAAPTADRAGLRQALGIPALASVIGTVGRLSPEKGHACFLQAASEIVRQYPDTRFLLVGDGPERAALERLAGEAGIAGATIFAGIRDDVPALLAAMDIFVLPSLIEGMPMALLEAMAARKPVVATRVGAVPQVIDDGKNGVLVAPGDAAALAAGIKRVLRDAAAAQGWAEAAYRTVEQEYSAAVMAEHYAALYRETENDTGGREVHR
jgi:glycosyltransferase involved in cell wall biosynthesis